MESNNCSNNLEKLGSFCSDCKIVLKSIYSLGSASSINECESFNKESKDRNSLLNKYKQNLKQEIINKNNEKMKHPQFFSYKNKLPSPILNNNDKSNITSREQVLLYKKSPMKESTKMRISNDYTEHLIHTKPKIIEDRILKNTEQLTMNTWKRQKLETSNYKHENSTFEQIYSIDSKNHKTTKYANTQYSIEIPNTQNSFEIPKYFDSQSTKCEIDFTKEPDYIDQLNTLKSIILNRRKKVLKIAQDLLTLR